ncbi:MAG: AEC family transporter [Clostridia bacterium]|nr:AEC family transporter [Clostridia bacterium]
MIALFEQTLILFLFIAVGFGLARTKIIHGEHAKILSELLVYIFLPCNCVMTFSSNFTVKYITEKYTLIIASAVLIIVIGVIMHFVARLFSKNEYERVIYEYSLVMPNYGGVGYPIAMGIFGIAGLTDAMVFAIPMSIYAYTYGYASLTKRNISLNNIFNPHTLLMLVNPVTASMFIGMIMGLTGFSLPNFMNSAITSASGCLAPVAMLIVGITIADFDLKKLLSDIRTYIVVALRLIVQPLLFGGIMWLLGIRGAVLTSSVMFLALPCGMNTVTLPRLFDENCEIGASMALVSNVLACVTIPLVLALFGIGG